MRTNLTLLLSFLFLAIGCKTSETTSSATSNKEKEGTPSITGFTSGMDAYSGFFPFYWDTEKDKIYLEIDKLNYEFLYVNSLAAGVGSNDLGLDRGQLGRDRIVKFERHGQKVLLIQPNYQYRAVSENAEEVRSVKEAFASSVIYGFEVKAKSDWGVLIDITDFLLRDSHKVSERLSSLKQGKYKPDNSRSVLYRENTINFPKNTEFESIITFTGEPKGNYIRSVTPSPEAVTVRMHHSFIELPDSDYQPRKFDPRSGFIPISYQDYATPIDESLVKSFIIRHRLQKKNTDQERSEPVEPIIYYLDPGAPEPVRSALLDGARWWNQAFEEAGFINAFRVEMLPEGAHPLDVRYHVIQWVHRSTRGWSYGSSVVDPRTGEIIKGHVSLGSLRVRQDFLIAQGLLNQYDEGTAPMLEMALARIRQLSAHEVGHTLGLVHNYSASTNNRASVMDYPHPLVQLDGQGNISLDEAYYTNIGEWDITAIKYGYAQFPENEEEKLNELLENAFADGEKFISDQDARPKSGAHPEAHLWDNGENAASELNRVMQVRKVALDQLSEKALPAGMPYSSLEEILVPIYLFHRYQVEADVKLIGGLNYNYAVKGGNQVITEMLPAEMQMQALNQLISTIKPDHLMLREDLIKMIPPKALGYSRNRETFASKTGPVWDYYTAVETAAQLPLQLLLMPERANRLVVFSDRDPAQPGLESVLKTLTDQTWKSASGKERERAIQRIVEWKMLHYLMQMATSEESIGDVKAISRDQILKIRDYVSLKKGINPEDSAHYQLVKYTIDKWVEEPDEVEMPGEVKAPDGSPIGSDLLDFCSF